MLTVYKIYTYCTCICYSSLKVRHCALCGGCIPLQCVRTVIDSYCDWFDNTTGRTTQLTMLKILYNIFSVFMNRRLPQSVLPLTVSNFFMYCSVLKFSGHTLYVFRIIIRVTFSFLNKLEVRYLTIARCPTKTVSSCTFYDKILDTVASFSLRLHNGHILLQWPEISIYKRVKNSKFLRGHALRPSSADRHLFSKYILLLQILT